MSRLTRQIVLLGAPLFVGVINLFHPVHFDATGIYAGIEDQVDWWITLHTLNLAGFALLGLAAFLLVKDQQGFAARIAKIALAIFVPTYVGFDSIIGIGIGTLIQYAKNLPPTSLLWLRLHLTPIGLATWQPCSRSLVQLLEGVHFLLLPYEPEVSDALTFALRKEGMGIVTNAQVLRGAQKPNCEIEVVAHVNGKEQIFTGQKLLVATGREPNTDGIGLEKVGIQLDNRGYIIVNDELQTNIPNIWAAGDVIGNQMDSQPATPVGAHDGVIAAINALANAHRKIDHRVIPRTIFTDPQVAVVGQTDEEAVGSGIRCWCSTIPLELFPRAGATHQTDGIAKVVINRETQEVVGVSLVMPNAGEVIHEAAMAMRFHAKLEDYIDMIHVYPTMAEALKIAAISYFKDPAKLSCCAE